MKRLAKNWRTLFTVCLIFGLCLTGCEEGTSEPARVYTEQTAQALIDAGEHIGTCLIFAAFVRGMLNK